MAELPGIVVHGNFDAFHKELEKALTGMEATFKVKGTELGKVFADAFSAQLKDVNAVFQAIQSASKQAGDSLKNMEAPMSKISSGAKQVSNTFEIANKQIAGMVAAYKDASVSSVNFGKSIQDVNSLASTTLNQTANAVRGLGSSLSSLVGGPGYMARISPKQSEQMMAFDIRAGLAVDKFNEKRLASEIKTSLAVEKFIDRTTEKRLTSEIKMGLAVDKFNEKRLASEAKTVQAEIDLITKKEVAFAAHQQRMARLTISGFTGAAIPPSGFKGTLSDLYATLGLGGGVGSPVFGAAPPKGPPPDQFDSILGDPKATWARQSAIYAALQGDPSIKIVKSLNDVNMGLGESEKRLKAVSDGADKTGRSFGDMVTRHASWVASGLVLFKSVQMAGDAFRRSIQAQEELGRMKAVTGLPVQEIQKMDVALRGLQSAFPTQELREATTNLMKMGIGATDTAANVEGLTSILQKAETIARVEGTTVKNVTEQIAAIGLAFGKSSSEVGDVMPQIMDKVAAVANVTRGSMGDLRDSILRVGGAAHEFGLSLDQTIGIVALFRQHGMEATTAGTSLRTLLTRLQDPPKELIKIFDALNHQFGTNLKQGQDFMTVIKQLKDVWPKLTDEVQGYVAANFGLNRNVLGVIMAIRNFDGELKNLIEISKNAKGTIDDMADAMDTPELRIKRLQKAWGDLLEGLGKLTIFSVPFIDAVSRMGESLRGLAGWVHNLGKASAFALGPFWGLMNLGTQKRLEYERKSAQERTLSEITKDYSKIKKSMPLTEEEAILRQRIAGDIGPSLDSEEVERYKARVLALRARGFAVTKGVAAKASAILTGEYTLDQLKAQMDEASQKGKKAHDSIISGLPPMISLTDQLNDHFAKMAERLRDIDVAAEKMKLSLGLSLSPGSEAVINLISAIDKYELLKKQIKEVEDIRKSLQGRGEATRQQLGNIPGISTGIVSPISGGYQIPSGGTFGASRASRRPGGIHEGLDFAVPTGTPVGSAMAGRVAYIGNNPGGYGLYIDVQHVQGLITRYAHLSTQNVKVGQSVSAGQLLGLSGATGGVSGPHLHFETRGPGGAMDPAAFLQGARIIPGGMTSAQRAGVQDIRGQHQQYYQAENNAARQFISLRKEFSQQEIQIEKARLELLKLAKERHMEYLEALAGTPLSPFLTDQEALNANLELIAKNMDVVTEKFKQMGREAEAETVQRIHLESLEFGLPTMTVSGTKRMFKSPEEALAAAGRKGDIIKYNNEITKSQYEAIQQVLKFKETELKEFNRVENDKVDAAIQSNSQLLELGKIRKDQEIAMNKEVVDSYIQQLRVKRALTIADIKKKAEDKGEPLTDEEIRNLEIIKQMDNDLRDFTRKSEQYSFDLTRNLMEPVIQMKKTLESAFDDFFYNLITGSAQTGNILQNIFNNVAKQISQSMSQSVMYSLGLGPKPQSGTGDILSQVFGLFNKPRMAQPDMAMANATLAAAGGFGEQPIAGTQWGNVGSEAGAGMAGAATAGSFGSKGGGILGFIGKYAGIAGIAASLITSLFPKVDAKTSHENRNYLLPEIDKTFKGMAELFVTPFKLVQTIIEEQKDGPNVHRIYSYVEKSMGSMWTAFGAMFPNITKNIQTVYDKLNFSNQMVQGIEKGLLPGSAQDIEKYKGVSAQYSQFAGQFGQTMMDVARQVWPNIMQLAIQAGTTIEEQVQALAAANTEKARQYAEILNGKMNELMGAIATTGSKLVDRLIGNVLGWGVPGTSAFLSGAPGISKPGPPVKQITPTFAGLQQFTQQQGLQGMYLPQGMYENYLAGGGRDTLIDFLSYGKGQMGYNNPAWNIPDVYASQYLQSISKQNAAQAQAPSILGDMGGRLAEGSTAVAPWQQQVSVVGTRFPNITKLITQIRNSVFNSADEMVQQEATGYAQALEQQWAQLIGTKAPEIKQAAFFAGQNVVDYFIKLVNSGNAQAIEIMALLESQAMDIFGVKEKIEQTALTSGNAFVDYWIKAIIPDFTKMGYSSFRMGFPTFGTRKLDERFQILFKQLSGGTDLAKPEFQQYASAAQELLQQILLAKIPDLKKMAFYSGMSIFEMFEGMISSGNQVAVDILNEYQTRFDEIFKDAKDQLDKGMEPFKVYDIVRSLSTGVIQAYGISTFTPQSFKDQPSTQITGPVNISVSVPAGATSEEIIKLFQSAFSQMGGQVIFTSA